MSSTVIGDTKTWPELAIGRQRDVHAPLECGEVKLRRGLLGTPQNGVLTDDGEQLAGHERVEMHQAARLHLHPFGMAARQANQAVVQIRVAVQDPQDLGFFAAHHIG